MTGKRKIVRRQYTKRHYENIFGKTFDGPTNGLYDGWQAIPVVYTLPGGDVVVHGLYNGPLFVVTTSIWSANSRRIENIIGRVHVYVRVRTFVYDRRG